MNIETGKLLDLAEVMKLPQAEQQKYVEVKRDLTLLERANMQVKMYAPCGCGSGKKFKFCCYKGSAT